MSKQNAMRTLFTKDLNSLVKGIRSHRRDSASYISARILEIKEELRSGNAAIKTCAVQKATYLAMLGYSMSFASFNVVEVMSLPRFSQKRIGMLAATQIFDAETDILLLCVNLFKKEIQSKNYYEAGIALNALANVANRDLSRDLMEDVAAMLSSSKPYLRKKSILTMYKMLLRYPQGLRDTYDRLRQKLDDPELAVISCAVNVMCELSRTNPRNYLPLAPQLFQLLTTTSNNWMLIKIVKLMGSLLQEEPRLARKLLEPLSTIIQTTPAKSLLYECISTVTQALQFTARADGSQPKAVPGIVELCTSKLREFVEDPDQNLKYLGLVGLVALMQSHPRVVAEHRELVLRCLLDEDTTVRLRALELLTGMVTKRNLVDIVQKLLEHVQTSEGRYRDDLIGKIIFVCSRDKYAYLSNFAWYISVLVDLAHIQGTPHGELVASQLLDVAVRVPSVRRFAAHAMSSLLQDGRLALMCGEGSGTNSVLRGEGAQRGAMSEVLYAAAFVACEYADLLVDRIGDGCDDSCDGDLSSVDLLELSASMLQPKTQHLPPQVQAVYVHNVLKLVAALARNEFRYITSRNELKPPKGKRGLSLVRQMVKQVVYSAKLFTRSEQAEVQERAMGTVATLEMLGLCSTRDFDENRSSAEVDRLQGMLIDTSKELVSEEMASILKSGAHSMIIKPSVVSCDNELGRIVNVLDNMFGEELSPVNSKAQRRVPTPEGLDLDRQLFESLSDVNDDRGALLLSVSFEKERTAGSRNRKAVKNLEWLTDHSRGVDSEDGGKVLADLAAQSYSISTRDGETNVGVALRNAADPFYLGGSVDDSHGEKSVGESFLADDDVDDIPVVRLVSGELGRLNAGTDGLYTSKQAGFRVGLGVRRVSSNSAGDQPNVAVVREEAMPVGAIDSDDEAASCRRSKRASSNELTLADIDVTKDGGSDASDSMPRKHCRLRKSGRPNRSAEGDRGKGSRRRTKHGHRRRRVKGSSRSRQSVEAESVSAATPVEVDLLGFGE